jgi:hypothetical protein
MMTMTGPPCPDSGPCPMNRLCRIADHSCVQCLSSTDCMPDEACEPVTNNCVPSACVEIAE